MQVFLKVASCSAETDRDLDDEEYRQQMEQLTDSQYMHMHESSSFVLSNVMSLLAYSNFILTLVLAL